MCFNRGQWRLTNRNRTPSETLVNPTVEIAMGVTQIKHINTKNGKTKINENQIKKRKEKKYHNARNRMEMMKKNMKREREEDRQKKKKKKKKKLGEIEVEVFGWMKVG